MSDYIDTSVLAAYYCPEPLSRAAQRALSRAGQPVISPLVELELYSAVAGKVRTGELDATAAGSILSTFQAHVDAGHYRFTGIESAHFQLARDWVRRFSLPLRTLDALHLAASHAGGLRLVTADRQLSQAATTLGVKCQLLA